MMTRFLGVALCLMALCSLGACVAPVEDKLGGDGEVCFADEDCRQAFVCNRNACVDPNIRPDDNNAQNNSNNINCDLEDPNCICVDAEGFFCDPGGASCECNLVSQRFTCDQACGYLEECGIFQDQCVEQCDESFQRFTFRQEQDFLECLLNLSCRNVLEGSEDCFDIAQGEGREPDPVPPVPSP